jgi:hypothetical protein
MNKYLKLSLSLLLLSQDQREQISLASIIHQHEVALILWTHRWIERLPHHIILNLLVHGASQLLHHHFPTTLSHLPLVLDLLLQDDLLDGIYPIPIHAHNVKVQYLSLALLIIVPSVLLPEESHDVYSLKGHALYPCIQLLLLASLKPLRSCYLLNEYQ